MARASSPLPILVLAGLLAVAAACSDDAPGSGDASLDVAEDTPRGDLDATGEEPLDATEDPAPTDLGDLPSDEDEAGEDEGDTALDVADLADTSPADASDTGADPDLGDTDAPDASDAPTADAADAVDDPDGDTDALDAPSDPDAADTPSEADTDASDASADLDLELDLSAEPDAIPLTCEELTVRIESEGADAAFCERSTQCAVRDNPLCPFGGCFTYYRAGADLTGLFEDQMAFSDQRCSSLHCACPLAPPVPFCDEGTCQGCPTTCPYTCDLGCECVRDGCDCDLPLCVSDDAASCAALGEALTQAAEDLAGCRDDSDCVAVETGLCEVLPCDVAVHRQAAVEHLATLVEGWRASGCDSGAACTCVSPGVPTCVEGRCRLP